MTLFAMSPNWSPARCCPECGHLADTRDGFWRPVWRRWTCGGCGVPLSYDFRRRLKIGLMLAAHQLLIKAVVIGWMLVFTFAGQSLSSVCLILAETLVLYLLLGFFLIPLDDRILAAKPNGPK